MPQSMQVKPSRVLRLFTLQKHKKFPPLAGESLSFRDEPPSTYILKTFLKIPPRCCVLLPRACSKSVKGKRPEHCSVSPWGHWRQLPYCYVSKAMTGGQPACHCWHWRPHLGCWMQDSNPQDSSLCSLLRCSLLNFVFTFCSLSTQHQTNRQESRRCEHKEQASGDPGIQEINILAPMAIDNQDSSICTGWMFRKPWSQTPWGRDPLGPPQLMSS